MTKGIYISYDLSVEGDYANLFKWLDQNKARECGESLAYLNISLETDDILKEITEKIKSAEFKPKKNDRLYVIYRDSMDRKIKGDFIFGGRTRAPWEGFFKHDEIESEPDIIE